MKNRETISACVYDTLFRMCRLPKVKFIRSRNNIIFDTNSISANQLRFPLLGTFGILNFFNHKQAGSAIAESMSFNLVI